MAKRQSVKRRQPNVLNVSRGQVQGDHGPPIPMSAEPNSGIGKYLEPITTGGFSALLVYVAYHPSDSVLVEQGDAIWFCMIAFILVAVGQFQRVPMSSSLSGINVPRATSNNDDIALNDSDETTLGSAKVPRNDRLPRNRWIWNAALTLLPWCLALWMILAAFMTSPPGNLRASTNEAWLWLAAAAILHTVRHRFQSLAVRRSLICVMLVIASGLAVHGLHQYGYSLPQNRDEYRKNPEAVLRMAGIDAPAGSSERMIFENRLMDGGPSATFALANTLAGYLLIAAVICSTLLITSWQELDRSKRITLSSIILLCLSCLLATRSRTAMLAFLFSLVIVLFIRSRVVYRRRRSLAIGAALLILLSVLGLGFLNAYGNREWFEQAPTSVAFRFQYWRSTWALAVESPWFGAGPGNFQAIYERYREASASEQIAEPHHFLMETLAAGGFPAVAVLMMLGALILVQQRRINRSEARVEAPSQDKLKRQGHHRRLVYLGAVGGLCIVWLSGLITLQLPDVVASVFVIPVCLFIAMPLNRVLEGTTSRTLNLSLLVGLAAFFTHLSMSGGWTVPGLAIWAWLIGGFLSSPTINDHNTESADFLKTTPNPRANASFKRFSRAWPIGLLLCFWWISFRPNQAKIQALANVTRAQQLGNQTRVEETIQQSVDADSWSPEPAIWLADYYRWRMILQPDQKSFGGENSLHDRWKSSVEEIRRRVKIDASIERLIGVQAIHLYQHGGRLDDLELARLAFQRALSCSPSDEWLLAQLSLIMDKLGQNREAQALADKAINLSRLGNNIERDLSRQMIYVPIFSAEQVKEAPKRQSAAGLIKAVLEDEPT